MKKDIENILIEENLYETIEDNKLYKFNNEHNQSLVLDYWWQEAPEGKTLFLVLYTKRCKWNRCQGCNLPMLSSEVNVAPENLAKQIDYIFNYIIKKEELAEVKKIIISNNGSIFDNKTFPTPLLNYLFLQLSLKLPNLKKVTLETRPEFCNDYSLELIYQVLNSLKEEDNNIKIEIAIGFEIFDETLRNRTFKKGLSFKLFEAFIDRIKKYNYEVKTYFMVKPIIGMTEEEGKKDIENAINYIVSIKEKTGVKINIHLNPTYAAKNTILEEAFYNGTFTPPQLITVVDLLLKAKENGIEIFAGLFDEGLAVEGGSCLRTKDLHLVPIIEKFNRIQDITLLQEIKKSYNFSIIDEESRIISEKELTYIEKKANTIHVITPTLENDINTDGDIFNIVKENLKENKHYTYIVPFNNVILNAIKKYKKIHTFEKNQVIFYVVPENDFMFTSETLIYNLEDKHTTSVIEWKPTANNTYIKVEDYFKDKIINLALKIKKEQPILNNE